MKIRFAIAVAVITGLLLVMNNACSSYGSKDGELIPKNGNIRIPLKEIDDGKAHYFNVKADDGITVKFFVLKSRDGIVRAAIDACDVCFRSGKGYVQEGDYMVCQNCGQRFLSSKINEVKGGCNPAPLKRKIEGQDLIISMNDINMNSWYCKLK
ncbi:Fe-S-containing protein [Thermodesulfobacteriota bacterium]